MMEKSDEISICDENVLAVKTVDVNAKDNLLKSNADSDKMTTTPTKCDAKMADDDKCINNQDICNNMKNVHTNNKADCNVVIDDDTQSKQQQQQPQSPPLPPSSPRPSPPKSQQTYGCVHYKRKAKFVVSQKRNKNPFGSQMISFHFLILFLYIRLCF